MTKKTGRIVCSHEDHKLTAQQVIKHAFTNPDGIMKLKLIQDQFYIWDDKKYVAHTYKSIEYAVSRVLNKACVTKSISDVDDEGKSKNNTSYVPYYPNIKRVNEVMREIRLQAHVEGNLSSPCWLPSAPESITRAHSADNILAVSNGLLDIIKLELLGHTPHFFNTSCAIGPYNPNETSCPNYERYLGLVFGDDEQTKDVYEEMMAYTFLPTNKFKKAFFWQSPEDGGKNTALEFLGDVFGDVGEVAASVMGCDLSDFNPGNTFAMQKMIGTRVLHFDEPVIDPKDRKHSMAKIKAITGGSNISINKKQIGTPWTGRVNAKIIILSNTSPDFHDSSGAGANRFVFIETNHSFNEKDKIPDYYGNYLRPEFSAILNRKLKALQRLLDRGHFVEPESSQNMRDVMAAGASPIREFLMDNPKFDYGDDSRMSIEDVYVDYEHWCVKQRYRGAGSKIGLMRSIMDAHVPGIKCILKTRYKDPGTGEKRLGGLVIGIKRKHHYTMDELPENVTKMPRAFGRE